MLFISLTRNFSDPFISTGTHFISFYIKMYGLRSNPEAETLSEAEKEKVIKA